MASSILLENKKGLEENPQALDFNRLIGAQGQNRTADTGIFSPLLYRLSYLGVGIFAPIP